MIEAVREQLVLILHTSEGARVAMSCLCHGTPKVRISTLYNPGRKYTIQYYNDILKRVTSCQGHYNALAGHQDRCKTSTMTLSWGQNRNKYGLQFTVYFELPK